MLGPQFEQMQLFNAGLTRPRTAGDMSPDEWHEKHKDSIFYHGTFRGADWDSAPTVHMGTLEAASARLNDLDRDFRNSPWMARLYYDPKLAGTNASIVAPEDDVTVQHEGRVFSRRVPKGLMHSTTVHDQEANAADLHHALTRVGMSFDETSPSVRESVGTDRNGNSNGPKISSSGNVIRGNMSGRAIGASIALKRGRAVPYINVVEGGTSIIVDPRRTSSWESEQLDDPNSSPIRRDFARQRIASNQEGSVPYKAPGEVVVQPTLDGGQRVLRSPQFREVTKFETEY